jgi:hypothetical protein
VAALTVRAMETFALVVAVVTADSDGDGAQNRVATKVSRYILCDNTTT